MFNKKKNKVEWTDKTAPKQRKLEFNLTASLGIKPIESYNNNIPIASESIHKLLLVDTDSPKEDIKEALMEQFEIFYTEVCKAIDSSTDFSEGFWKDKQIKEEETNFTL
jgi:methyltransferase-like protein